MSLVVKLCVIFQLFNCKGCQKTRKNPTRVLLHEWQYLIGPYGKDSYRLCRTVQGAL